MFFPQAVVPAIFKLNDVDAKSWFLALHTPPAWQWPVIAGMALLGLGMYAYGGLTYYQASKLKPESAEAETVQDAGTTRSVAS